MAASVRRPLVHIGFHKTGTSWLQRHLFTAANPVFEPLSVRPHGHSSLARSFVWGPDGYLLAPFDDNEPSITAHLAEIMAVRGDRLESHVPVMSHERLSGNPHASGFDARVVADRLASTFPQARILIVIREQVDVLLSNYRQYLFIGGTRDLEDYLTEPYDGKRPGFSPHHFDYPSLVTYHRELFGPDDVLVMTYEQFRDDPTTFLAHLGGFVGRTVTVESGAVDSVENRVAAPAVLHGIRRLNGLRRSSSVNHHSRLAGARTALIVDDLAKEMERQLPDEWRRRRMAELRATVRDFVGDRYRAGNRHLAEMTGLDLEGFGYRC